MLDYIPKFAEKVAWRTGKTKQMRHLADDSHIDQSFNEASHDRRGDKAGHPAHTHDAKEKEKQTDHDGQGGRERVVLRGALSCDGADGERGDQTGGGIRSNNQLTRSPKKGISHECRDYRVETHD